MKESFIEIIEEAVTGKELFNGVANAFTSLVGSNIENQLETEEISKSDYDLLPIPDNTNILYFITDY